MEQLESTTEPLPNPVQMISPSPKDDPLGDPVVTDPPPAPIDGLDKVYVYSIVGLNFSIIAIYIYTLIKLMKTDTSENSKASKKKKERKLGKSSLTSVSISVTPERSTVHVHNLSNFQARKSLSKMKRRAMKAILRNDTIASTRNDSLASENDPDEDSEDSNSFTQEMDHSEVESKNKLVSGTSFSVTPCTAVTEMSDTTTGNVSFSEQFKSKRFSYIAAQNNDVTNGLSGRQNHLPIVVNDQRPITDGPVSRGRLTTKISEDSSVFL